jgi:hypothetical protein
MSNKEAFDRAYACLGQRTDWEQRQKAYYDMRHDGLRRLNKPWPMAADFHFPMIDMNIGNLKPFWVAQAFSGERLVDFVCMRQQLADMTESAADYLDFELRYNTDYRYRLEQAVDMMLLTGRGILKIMHEPKKHRIRFRSIDPRMILMDRDFDDFDDADEFTEIQILTVEQYKRNPNYEKKADVLNAIRGRPDWSFASPDGLLSSKEAREGVTHSNKADRIVLWHNYKRRESDWVVTTFAPAAMEMIIRKPFSLPYSWDGEPLQPFYSLTMEIKEDGWFAPRGIAELNAAFEAYACKLWNEKSDAMTFGNRPLFTTDNADIQSGANLRFLPGELVPGNITAVQMPPPAFSFAEEINFTRGVSEQRSRMPDYGVTDEGDPGKPRTATENNRISALQDVGADHNGDVFRNTRLIKIYKHIWALQVQYQKPKMVFYAAEELQTLPAEALHQAYLVIPAGGSGTKQQKVQRAGMRYQLFKGAPNIDQDELARDVIAADDSRLVKKLLLPQNQRQQQEYVDQVIKINAGLALGFPVPPNASEDQGVRIKACIDWLHKEQVMGSVNPIAIQSVQMHIAARFQMLQQINPAMAKQVKGQIQQMEQQQQQQQPPNAVPMPGGGQGGQQAEQPQPQPQPAAALG